MVTGVQTKKIDADTHFNLTVDYQNLRDLLDRNQSKALNDVMLNDALRVVDPDAIRAALAAREGPSDGHAGDPSWDPEVRIKEMDKLGFDMQVLNCQRAMPSPLKAQGDTPLWLRTALAKLYNNKAAALQKKYPDRFIYQITFPWDDIDASVKEVEVLVKP